MGSKTRNKSEMNSQEEDIDSKSQENGRHEPITAEARPLPGIESFEDLLELAGTSGRWNLMVFVLGCFCTLMNPMQLISYEFLGATPNHWCHVHALHKANWTHEQILTLAIPLKSNNTQEKIHEKCLMYDYDYDLAARMGYDAAINNLDLISRGGSVDVIPCHSRDFNLTQYKSTVVTEWDLVCERRALYSTTQAASQIGTLLGYLFLGTLLDYFGRRRVVLSSVVLSIITGFGAAAANSYELYVVLKTIVSMVIAGFFLGCFVVVMELCSPKQRSSVGSMYVVPWALGYMAVPGIAYLVREWRWLQATYTFPVFTLCVYFWLLPESPRWLMMKGRFEDALKVLSWAAKVNGKTLPSTPVMLATMHKLNRQEKSSTTTEFVNKSFMSRVASSLENLFSLLINSKLRGRTLINFTIWFVATMVYYGLSLNSTNLSADPYQYVFLGGVLEVPSYFLLWAAIAFLGRRATLILLYVICGVSIAAIASIMYLKLGVPVEWLMVLSLSGKVAITAAFHLVFIYTAELYPTKYRSLALSQCNVVCRFGSISSPYINDILGQVVSWGPSALFASASVGAAGLALLLPETKGRDLSEGDGFEGDDSLEISVKKISYHENKAFDPS